MTKKYKEFSVVVANKEQFEAVRDVLEGMGYTAYCSREYMHQFESIQAFQDGDYTRECDVFQDAIPYNQFMQEHGKKEVPMALYTWEEVEDSICGSVFYVYKPTGEYLASSLNVFDVQLIVNELNKLLTKE